jgi:hypothetical protein
MNFASLMGALWISATLLSFTPHGQAQTVYSVNALGYADVALSPGSNFITFPFASVDARVSRLLPTMPPGTYLTFWDHMGQTFGPTNHYGSSGWSDPAMELRFPAGALLWVTQAMTISFTGELIQGSISGVLRLSGLHVLGVIPSQGYFVCSDFDQCPASVPPDQTTMCRWNPVAQECTVYIYMNLGPESGWYDSFGTKVDVQLAPGEAAVFYVPQTFYIPNIPASTNTSPGLAITGSSRTPTNFTIQFHAPAFERFSVVRANSLTNFAWPVIVEDTTTGTLNSVTFPETAAPMAFFRLFPASSYLQLIGSWRTPGQFQFSYYAPSNGSYVVERRAPSLTWTPVMTNLGVMKGLRRVTHLTSGTSPAQYRVRLEP